MLEWQPTLSIEPLRVELSKIFGPEDYYVNARLRYAGFRRTHGLVFPFLRFNERNQDIEPITLGGARSCRHETLDLLQGCAVIPLCKNRSNVHGRHCKRDALK